MDGKFEPRSSAFLKGGGETGALLRAHRWSENPLGDPCDWPHALKTLVEVMLNARQPMFVAWGPERILIYNDAYAVLCGARHPALGKRFEDVWFDIMDDVGPILDAAYAGQGTQMDDIRLTMHRNGYAEEAHFAFSYTPVRDESGAVSGMFCACSETTEEVKARASLDSEATALRGLFEQAPSFMAVLTGPDHVFKFANPMFDRLVGHREVIGKTVREALPEVEGQGYFELLDAGFRTGEAFTGSASPVTLPVAAFAGPASPLSQPIAAQGPTHERFVDFVYQPTRNEAGEVSGIFVEGHDVTDRVHAEERRNLLLREMDHRVKNIFAITGSLVSLSARTAATPAEMARALSERLRAMAESHDLIRPDLDGVSDPRAGARLDDLVWTILRPYLAGGRPERAELVDLDGPVTPLSGVAVTNLALVLHELATNAAKYGALSRPEGRLAIQWSVAGPGLRLEWRETGGPRLDGAPAAGGFGTRLIGGALTGLEGAIDRNWAPEGLSAVLTIPVARLT